MRYEDKYFIQSDTGYVGNAAKWWGNKGGGYTCDIRKAGVYTEQEAKEICNNRQSDKKYKVEDILPLMKPIIDGQDLGIIKEQMRED